MPNKKASQKVRKHLGKKNPKIDVMDEWERADIDRDEQRAGLKRRARRWKEVELEQKNATKLEQEALSKANKMDKKKSILIDMTPLEEAWLRCDFILANIMENKAYEFMEWQRVNDVDTYKRLYRKFMSRGMMQNAQLYVDYFAKGGQAPFIITFPTIVRAYKKIKGIRSKIKVVHKGEDDREL